LKELKKILEKFVGNSIYLEESPLTEALREEKQFCDLMERLDQVWQKDNSLFEDYSVDLSSYLEHYYGIIELQMVMLFGYNKVDLIWWYILERKDQEGNLLPIEDINGNQYIFESHSDFYEFLKKAEIGSIDETETDI